MPIFKTVPIAEVKTGRGTSAAKQKTLARYGRFIKKLDEQTAGKVTLGKDEKYSTVRRYLKEASDSVGKATRVRREGNVLYVYLTRKRGTRKN